MTTTESAAIQIDAFERWIATRPHTRRHDAKAGWDAHAQHAAATPALPVPGTILTWRERIIDGAFISGDPGQCIAPTGASAALAARDAEIDDLRAALAAPASVPQPAVPMEAIEKILSEVMQTASDNGANSVSMPDEYVAVAHFVAYPHRYAQPAAQGAPWVGFLKSPEGKEAIALWRKRNDTPAEQSTDKPAEGK